MDKKHISDITFDDYLDSTGMRDEVEELAAKKMFIYQLESEMKRQKITKTEMASRLGTSRSSLDRTLSISGNSTIDTLEKVARVLGKRIEIQLVDFKLQTLNIHTKPITGSCN